MSKTEWSRDFSVGIDAIDEQHQRLFRAFDVLRDAVDRNMGGDQLSVIFLEMISYVWRHLRYEEKMLKKFDYPDLEQHKALHAKLEEELNDLNDQYELTNQDKRDKIARQMADFLERWLLEHINVEDKVYSNYLKEERKI